MSSSDIDPYTKYKLSLPEGKIALSKQEFNIKWRRYTLNEIITHYTPPTKPYHQGTLVYAEDYIVHALKKAKKAMSASEIAEHTPYNPGGITRTLKKMRLAKQINFRVSGNKYLYSLKEEVL